MNTRRKKISELLLVQGEIGVSELAAQLNVSEMTVYRDIAVMESEGLLYKKRGAVVHVDHAVPTEKRTTDYLAAEKLAIAAQAALHIQDGDSVIFDNSTTALEVARLLRHHERLTVYSTSLDVANVLRDCPNIVLYCSGGFYLHASYGFVGSIAEQFVEMLHADKCVVGTSGISLTHGLTGPYPHHSSLQRKIMNAADKVILVADHSKFGKTSIERVAGLDQVDVLVTDDAADAQMVAALQAQMQVILAAVDRSGRK